MRILVAYDGSTAGRRALDWAARLAKDEAESSVRVIGVAATLEAAPPIADAVDPGSSVEMRRRDLAEALSTLSAAGVRADTTLKVGNPAEEIIAASDEGDFELIVLGSTGAGRAVRFLLGSVTDRVARHANRPVMVVR
jgi:nucleotide-binding universal stress UspA family protein